MSSGLSVSGNLTLSGGNITGADTVDASIMATSGLNVSGTATMDNVNANNINVVNELLLIR